MTVKLLLAEALDLLKKTEAKERAIDKLMQEMTKNKTKRDFVRIKKQYSQCYAQYIKGLEMLNYCRRYGIDAKEHDLQNFCSQRMNAYMDHCDDLREKQASILMSVDQADASDLLDKEGFSIGETLLNKSVPVKQKEPMTWKSEAPLFSGAYQVIIKNYDDSSVNPPVIRLSLQLEEASGARKTFTKIVPGRCAWTKYVSLAHKGSAVIHVASDGWLRHSNVTVIFRQLEEIPEPDVENTDPGKPPEGWADILPELPPLPGAPAPAAPVGGIRAPGLPPALPLPPTAGVAPPAAPALGAGVPDPYGLSALPPVDFSGLAPPPPMGGVPLMQPGPLGETHPLAAPGPPIPPAVPAIPPVAPPQTAAAHAVAPPFTAPPAPVQPLLTINLPPSMEALPIRQRIEAMSAAVASLPNGHPQGHPAPSHLSEAERALLRSVALLPEPTELTDE